MYNIIVKAKYTVHINLAINNKISCFSITLTDNIAWLSMTHSFSSNAETCMSITKPSKRHDIFGKHRQVFGLTDFNLNCNGIFLVELNIYRKFVTVNNINFVSALVLVYFNQSIK